MADIVTVGPDRPRRPWPPRPTVLAAVLLIAAILAAVVGSIVDDRQRPVVTAPAGPSATLAASAAPVTPCLPVGWAQVPAVTDQVAGLFLDGAEPGLGASLERCDRTAMDGPWTVVVRRVDGSLGRHGAVVTYPVRAPAPAGLVDVGTVDVQGVVGAAQTGTVTWPIAGGYARVRGDLAQAELVAIAASTTVVAGRPSVQPPGGYAVVATGPYRPSAIHEARFGSAAVGERAALGDGLTYTGLTSGGGFEDQLYAATTSAVPVHHAPAVVSSVLGGNATLAWEPVPGLVAYVGYSGSQLDDRAIAALQRLAERAHLVTGTQWRATRPAVVEQVNEPG